MDSDMDVIWSTKAKITFYKILDYLNENWTKKEMIQFKSQFNKKPGTLLRMLRLFRRRASSSQRQSSGECSSLRDEGFGNLDERVYYEVFFDIEEAMAREKQIKTGSHQKKLDIVNAFNPESFRSRDTSPMAGLV